MKGPHSSLAGSERARQSAELLFDYYRGEARPVITIHPVAGSHGLRAWCHSGFWQ